MRNKGLRYLAESINTVSKHVCGFYYLVSHWMMNFINNIQTYRPVDWIGRFIECESGKNWLVGLKELFAALNN